MTSLRRFILTSTRRRNLDSAKTSKLVLHFGKELGSNPIGGTPNKKKIYIKHFPFHPQPGVGWALVWVIIAHY